MISWSQFAKNIWKSFTKITIIFESTVPNFKLIGTRNYPTEPRHYHRSALMMSCEYYAWSCSFLGFRTSKREKESPYGFTLLFNCLSFCPCIRLYVYPPVRLSALYVYPSLRLFVCTSARLYVCSLYACPTVRLSRPLFSGTGKDIK